MFSLKSFLNIKVLIEKTLQRIIWFKSLLTRGSLLDPTGSQNLLMFWLVRQWHKNTAFLLEIFHWQPISHLGPILLQLMEVGSMQNLSKDGCCDHWHWPSYLNKIDPKITPDIIDPSFSWSQMLSKKDVVSQTRCHNSHSPFHQHSYIKTKLNLMFVASAAEWSVRSNVWAETCHRLNQAAWVADTVQSESRILTPEVLFNSPDSDNPGPVELQGLFTV